MKLYCNEMKNLKLRVENYLISWLIDRENLNFFPFFLLHKYEIKAKT